MDYLGTLKGAITWLAGAVAALSALCYGAGYFALRTYHQMLGLDGIVSIGADEMLIEGAEFWRWLIYKLVLSLGLLVILVMILFMLFEHTGPLRRLGDSFRSRARSLWNETRERFPRLGSFAILLAFLAALELHSSSFDTIRALSLAPPRLLFNPDAATAYQRVQLLDPNELARNYFLLILLVLIAFSKRLGALVSKRATFVIRLGVGLYFAVYTLTLPGAYGVLLHKPVYPFALATGPGLRAGGYMLSQDDDSILLWLPERHILAWVPLRRVDAIRSGMPRNIFAVPKKGDGS